MTGYIPKVINISPRSKLKPHLWYIFNKPNFCPLGTLESLIVCTPNVSCMCLVGIWVLVPSVRRVGFIPTPQETNRDLRISHPLHHRLVHLHGEGVLLLQLQIPPLQVGNVPPQRGTLRVLVRNKLFLTSVKDRTHLLFHSFLLIEELGPQDSGLP